MDYKKPGILSYFVKALLLFFYLTFFIVQLFFNFDNANNPGSTAFLSSNKNAASLVRQSLVVKKGERKKDRTQSIRLNKRFEPAIILVYYWLDVKSPVHYLETNFFVSFCCASTTSSILYPQSFRGPPVVA